MRCSLIASLALVGACGGSPKSSSENTAPGEPSAPVATCESAASSYARVGFDEEVYDDAVRQEFTTKTLTACTRDAWSAEVIACTDDASTSDEIMACRAQLTTAQQDGLAAEGVDWPREKVIIKDTAAEGFTDTAGDGVDRDGKI
jgi:hypothetical protein